MELDETLGDRRADRTADMSTMTKGERTELRSIVRQQFKVLAAEVCVRRSEFEAEVDRELAEKFADRDLARRRVEDQMAEITTEANSKIRASFDTEGFDITGVPFLEFHIPQIRWGDDGRYERRRAAFAEIGARIQAALMQLQRQEADVLRTLAIDAIESEAAQQFLRSIPTVAELVPAQRLAALEASFEDDDESSRP